MGHNWADEHPIQMKAVEIGLGAACSLVSTIVVSWVTAKINAHYKKKREEEKAEEIRKEEEEQRGLDEDEVSELIGTVIKTTTEITGKYGPDWRDNQDAVEEFNDKCRIADVASLEGTFYEQEEVFREEHREEADCSGGAERRQEYRYRHTGEGIRGRSQGTHTGLLPGGSDRGRGRYWPSRIS